MFKKWLIVAAAVCGASPAAPAMAQFAGMNAILLDVNMGGFRAQVLREPDGESKNNKDVTSPLPKTNPALLSFTPNLATRQRNLAGFIAKTRAQSPESADQMEQMFGSTDLFAAFAQALAPMGLRVDNVADAYTAYWVTAWEASRGISGTDTPRAQAQAVKAQAAKALLSAPEFNKASAAQKQELAEALLIQTALISASMEAAGDPAQRDAIGKAVRIGAKAMGLHLDAMELGATGFVGVK